MTFGFFRFSVQCGVRQWIHVHTLLSCLVLDSLVALRGSTIQDPTFITTSNSCRESSVRKWGICTTLNEGHNGQHHRTLVNLAQATVLFMLRFFSFSVEVVKLMSCMIMCNLLFQDMPQQVCIVAYFHA